MYKNALGTIVMTDGEGTSNCKLKGVSGLGFVPKEYTINRFVGVAGQTATDGFEGARTVTISAEIVKCDSSTAARYSLILSEPGELYVHIGAKQRKIRCRCNDLSGFEERRKVFQQITVQFICDYPFFEDVSPVSRCLFARKNKIENSFTLPCVFTERIQRVKLINNGHKKTQLKVILYCEASATGAVKLINYTTNESFSLNYPMRTGEKVIIDFVERTISSNISEEENNYGNLLTYMASDSFLSSFNLAIGENDIECINTDSESVIIAVCEYSNKYIEAVY